MTSIHLLAIPKDMAARTILSIARLRIMQTDAPPNSPTMFARGTFHISKCKLEEDISIHLTVNHHEKKYFFKNCWPKS